MKSITAVVVLVLVALCASLSLESRDKRQGNSHSRLCYFFYDTNQDYCLYWDEFLAEWPLSNTDEVKLRAWFDEKDTDGSGWLSVAEYNKPPYHISFGKPDKICDP